MFVYGYICSGVITASGNSKTDCLCPQRENMCEHTTSLDRDHATVNNVTRYKPSNLEKSHPPTLEVSAVICSLHPPPPLVGRLWFLLGLSHRVLTPYPLPLLVAKVGRNHLNEDIAPSSPLG